MKHRAWLYTMIALALAALANPPTAWGVTNLIWKTAVDGGFADTANWCYAYSSGKSTGVEASNPPADGDTLFFGATGAYTMTVPENYVFTKFYTDYTGGDITLDMGGHVFTVTSHCSVKFGTLTLTNGTLMATRADQTYAFEVCGATAQIRGGGTELQMTSSGINVRMVAASASRPVHFDLSGGARLIGGVNLSGNQSDALARFSGSGTSVVVTNGTSVGMEMTAADKCATCILEDGAEMLLRQSSGVTLSGSGACRFVVDNAVCSNVWNAVNWNLARIRMGVYNSDNEMTVTNRGVYYGDGHLLVGFEHASSTNNVLSVVDGGLVELSVGSLYIGYGKSDADASWGNRLELRDGTISVPNCVLGYYSGSTNNAIVISGTNSLLHIGNVLTLNYNSNLGFTVPKDGYAQVPVQVGNGVYRNYNNGQSWLGDAPSMTVDCENWEHRIGGQVVLLACETKDAKNLTRTTLETLATSANANLAAKGSGATVEVAEDLGLQLVLTAPCVSSTLICIR